MNVVTRFQRLLFVQVVFGITVFTLATGHIGLLLLAGTLCGLAWFVTQGPEGKPFPPLVINAGALVIVALMSLALIRHTPIPLAVAYFVLWLQVLLLYARKSNRDYGHLQLLSFMLMIGATIETVSLFYGVVLFAYCTLAFVNLLLFQLKIAEDRVVRVAHEGAAVSEGYVPPAPVVGRGARWQFQLTASVIGLACALMAIAVFVLLPRRDTPPPAFEQFISTTKQQVGFSQVVDLNTSPAAGGSRDAVLTLRLTTQGGLLAEHSGGWLLRGAALDDYDVFNRTWRRGLGRARALRELDVPRRGLRLPASVPPASASILHAEVALRGGGTTTLFTLQPVLWFSSDSIRRLVYDRRQQQLLADSALHGMVQYAFETPLIHGAIPKVIMRRRPGYFDYARGWTVQPDRLRRLIESVLTERGISMPAAGADSRILERALDGLAGWMSDTRNFHYSLEHPPPRPGEDPIISFLFRDRQGHCEMYASAYAAMARCLGLRSRVITGYRASEYNEVEGYYIVRQADAHAWAEVFVPMRGWMTYDPTPPAEVAREQAARRPWLLGLRQRLEHLELLWYRDVVGYDARMRSALLGGIENRIQTSVSGQSWLANSVAWIGRIPHPTPPGGAGPALMVLLTLVLTVGAVGLGRWTIRNRRRLRALRLSGLGWRKRHTMARQLQFYVRMTKMLERRGFRRPLWQSPAEFAAQLERLYPQRFSPAVKLTAVFYEVRFGHRSVDAAKQEWIRRLLKELKQSLAIKTNP